MTNQRQFASEICFALRLMNATHGRYFVRQRLAAGDLEAAGAVVSGPSYLIGLADQLRASLKAEYPAAVDLDTAGRLNRLTEVINGATRASQALVEHSGAVHDRRAVDELKKAARPRDGVTGARARILVKQIKTA